MIKPKLTFHRPTDRKKQPSRPHNPPAPADPGGRLTQPLEPGRQLQLLPGYLVTTSSPPVPAVSPVYPSNTSKYTKYLKFQHFFPLPQIRAAAPAAAARHRTGQLIFTTTPSGGKCEASPRLLELCPLSRPRTVSGTAVLRDTVAQTAALRSPGTAAGPLCRPGMMRDLQICAGPHCTASTCQLTLQLSPG